MDEKIIIRKAKITDFKRIHKLVVQVHKLHLKERNDIYKDVDPMNFEEFKTELSNSNNICLIAELENQVVGICFSRIKETLNNKIMKNRKIIHIESFCIDKDYQKRGIGRKLYNKMIQLAKEKNINNIETMVWGFNKNAIKFYKNLGMNIKNLRFEQKIK